MRVGQWAIAVGRAFEGDRPNMSVGILSALERIWGKAIQTDAAVSPNNYGGPLVDVQGRVLGVLVPLSPQSESELSGIEWYDSGIGFAVPAEHILSILPKLESGKDLQPGRMGIRFASQNLHIEPPQIAGCHPRSPAALAGLDSGDRIVQIDARAIDRAAQVKEEISRRYAGDTMRVVVLRGKERLERKIELVAALPPYQHSAVGDSADPRRQCARASRTKRAARKRQGPARRHFGSLCLSRQRGGKGGMCGPATCCSRSTPSRSTTAPSLGANDRDPGRRRGFARSPSRRARRSR